jgi:hypothetical protein
VAQDRSETAPDDSEGAAGTRPRVLAYYFPSWHRDPRNARWFGEGWTEWELLKTAQPRFEGHRQPRIPARGYADDADPRTFDDEIGLAVDHGVDGFLFDFYWYEDGPYLNGALDRGFLGSSRCDELEFGIMWANHELTDIFPATPEPGGRSTLLQGELGAEGFTAMTDHVIAHYFSRENYLRIDGKPFFSIYEVGRFISGFGSLEAAAAALQDFERRTIAAGHPGLHLDCVLWGFGVLPEATVVTDTGAIVDALGFASATSYVWIHHADVQAAAFPHGDWRAVGAEAFDDYERSAATLDIPVHPNVSVGWDSSPRTSLTHPFGRGDYPWLPVWDGTPDDFAWGLRMARDFVARHRVRHPIVTINAWNEWTEGSYLLPDTTHGTAFLEKIVDVFGRRG